MKIIDDGDEIKWDDSSFFVIRENNLIALEKYKNIEIDEKYSTIFQTPSTPGDFGLILSQKKEPEIIDGINYPTNDILINSVLDYMIINPVDIKKFIKNEDKFLNYWE